MKRLPLLFLLTAVLAAPTGCRPSAAKFRFSPLPQHHAPTTAEVTPAPARPAPPDRPRVAAPPEAAEVDSVADAAELRPALDLPPPDITGRPPDSAFVAAQGRRVAPYSTPNIPAPRPLRSRNLLLLGAIVALGLVAASVAVVALPAILTLGASLTVLFLVGGVAVLVGRKIGKALRKKEPTP